MTPYLLISVLIISAVIIGVLLTIHNRQSIGNVKYSKHNNLNLPPCMNVAARKILMEYFKDHQGAYMIPKDDYSKLVEQVGDEDRTLIELANYAKSLATHTVISGYPVGACVVASSGHAYLGTNFEFYSVMPTTVHAEQCAVHNAAIHGEMNLTKLSVNASPCGQCRQFLIELGDPSKFDVITCTGDAKDSKLSTNTLDELLPANFGPANLKMSGRLLDSSPFSLTAKTPDADQKIALEMAKTSYAPYSNRPSGVTLMFKDRSIVPGKTMENAAYNPGLSAARAAYSLAGIMGKDFSDLIAMTMVESDCCKGPGQHNVSRKAEAEAILASINSKIKLEYIVAVMTKPKSSTVAAVNMYGSSMPLPL
jgi:cytidine deaminase